MSQPVDHTQVREISLTQKKQIMWNAIEPGDPYDIRKSMIASLPGQRKFMGAHLELVCLLQAAEIERLCMFLDEHKQKLRESERVGLDRHSYQIQIKELTEKISVDESLKIQNQKLKQFIRKQSFELEEAQRSQTNKQIMKKYEQSLIQMELLVKENTELKEVLQNVQGQVRNSHEQLKRHDSNKILQIEQFNRKLNQEVALRHQIQQEKINLSKYLQSQVKQYNEEIFVLQSKCSELSNVVQASERNNQILKEEKQKVIFQQNKNQQLATTMKQYENRFQMFATQIQRLNNCLRDKSKQLNELYVRNKQISDEISFKQQQNAELEVKVKNLIADLTKLEKQNKQIWMEKSTYQQRESLIHQYETRLQKLSFEVNRLNNVLRAKMTELQQTKQKLREQELTITNLQFTQKQINELRFKFSEITKKMFEYEKQITIQTQQIDRLNFTIKRLMEEINVAEVKVSNSEKELEHKIKKCVGMEGEIQRLLKKVQEDNVFRVNSNAKINQISAENQELKMRMGENDSLRRENEQIRGQLSQRYKQLEELNKVISEQNSKLEQKQQIINRCKEEEGNHQASISSLLLKLQSYEKQIKQIHDENSNLVLTLNQQQQKIQQISPPKIPYTPSEPSSKRDEKAEENQILVSQCHSLRMQLSHKDEEYKHLSGLYDKIMKQLDSKQELVFSLNLQLSNLGRSESSKSEDQIVQLKQEILRSSSQNISLSDALNNIKEEKRELQKSIREQKVKIEEMGQYYKKVLIFSTQIDRLNQVLQTKEAQIQNYLKSIYEYQQKVKSCEQKLANISLQLENHRRGSPERKLAENGKQLQLLMLNLDRSKAENRAKDENIQNYQSKLTIVGSEIERLNKILKEKLQENDFLVKENKDLKANLNKGSNESKIPQYELKLNEQNNEIQRLSKLILQKNESIQNQERQIHILKSSIDEYERNVQQYQQQISRLTKILQENANMITHVSQKDQNYLNEIERLNNLLRVKIEQCSVKDKQYESYNNQIQKLTLQLKQEKVDKEYVLNHPQREGQFMITKHEISNYSSKIKELQEEFQKLQIIIKTLQNQNKQLSSVNVTTNDLIEKNRWLGGQIDRLNVILVQKSNEVKDIRLSSSQNSALQKRVNEDMALMVILFAEIESLRQQIDRKQRHIQQMHNQMVMLHRV